jgi:hypothetical protein
MPGGIRDFEKRPKGSTGVASSPAEKRLRRTTPGYATRLWFVTSGNGFREEKEAAKKVR